MMVLMVLSMQIMHFRSLLLSRLYFTGCAFTDRASTRTLRIWFVHATSKGT